MRKQYVSPVALSVETHPDDILTNSTQFSVNYGEGDADEVIFGNLK